MDGGDVYLPHTSLRNLLLLIKCILCLPTGDALPSNGENKSSPAAFGFRRPERSPLAGEGAERHRVEVAF